MNAKNRTKLTPVMCYLPPEMVAELDRVRGDNSRAEEIRQRLARSLKTKRPRIVLGRRPRPPKESDDE